MAFLSGLLSGVGSLIGGALGGGLRAAAGGGVGGLVGNAIHHAPSTSHRSAIDRGSMAAAVVCEVRFDRWRRDGDRAPVVSAFRSLHLDRLNPQWPADASSK